MAGEVMRLMAWVAWKSGLGMRLFGVVVLWR